MPIRFFSDGVDFKIKSPLKIIQWINRSVEKEERKIKEVNIIFCTDLILFNLNKSFLSHHTLTDVITFDESTGLSLSGEIYISIERVEQNAQIFQVPLEEELHRVIIHGILHLIGYTDEKSNEKITMRNKEDAYLSLWKEMFHMKR